MATKYRRDWDEDEPPARISQRPLGRAQIRAGGPFSFRPGGSGLILSLGAVIFALMLLQNAVNQLMADPPPPTTSVATVMAKEPPDPDGLDERPYLQLQFELDEGAVLEVWVPTDPESWDRVQVGDQLEVDYRMGGTAGEVEVLGMRVIEDEPVRDGGDDAIEDEGVL